jgi:hypothetical protein
MLVHSRSPREKCGISLDIPPTSFHWAIQTQLLALEVAVADLGPGRLKGYGALSPAGRAQVLEIQQNLLQLIERAHSDFRPPSKS